MTEAPRRLRVGFVALVLALTGTLAGSGPTATKDPGSPVGTRVILKDGARLKVGFGPHSTDRATPLRIYRVEKTNGRWWWLVSESGDDFGWAAEEHVVPFEKAAEFFTEQIRDHPDAAVYIKRGLIHSERRKSDAAIADFDAAIRLDPKAPAGYLLRGLARSNRQEYRPAIADYTEAIRLDPQLVTAYTNRGAIESALGDQERAIVDFDAAIRLDPGNARAYLNRGNAWAALRQFDRTVSDFDAAVKLAPKFAGAYLSRGGFRLYRQDYDGAIADFDAAARLEPGLALAPSLRAEARFQKQEFDRVLGDYNRAIQADPRFIPAYKGRAWFLATCPEARFRDGHRALVSALRACDLTAWEDPECLSILAAAHAECGDFAQAVKWQTEALARVADQPRLAFRFRARLKLYEAKQPYRDRSVQQAAAR